MYSRVTTTSSKSWRLSRSTMCSMHGLLTIEIMVFGWLLVSGRSLVPLPPAMITAFMHPPFIASGLSYGSQLSSPLLPYGELFQQTSARNTSLLKGVVLPHGAGSCPYVRHGLAGSEVRHAVTVYVTSLGEKAKKLVLDEHRSTPLGQQTTHLVPGLLCQGSGRHQQHRQRRRQQDQPLLHDDLPSLANTKSLMNSLTTLTGSHPPRILQKPARECGGVVRYIGVGGTARGRGGGTESPPAAGDLRGSTELA